MRKLHIPTRISNISGFLYKLGYIGVSNLGCGHICLTEKNSLKQILKRLLDVWNDHLVYLEGLTLALYFS